MKIRELTKQERAAIWLYGREYAESNLGAIDFYRRLGKYQRSCIETMISDIEGAKSRLTLREKKSKV